MTFVKDGKEDFIQGRTIMMGIQTTELGFCSRERDWAQLQIYSKAKWDFIAKRQGGGQWMENY